MGYGNGSTGTMMGGSTGPNVIYNNAISPATPRVPVVVEQMNRLDNLTGMLSANLDELEHRLTGVLVLQPPTVSDEAKQPSSSVPLGAQLQELNARLNHTNARIRSLLDRLEL